MAVGAVAPTAPNVRASTWESLTWRQLCRGQMQHMAAMKGLHTKPVHVRLHKRTTSLIAKSKVDERPDPVMMSRIQEVVGFDVSVHVTLFVYPEQRLQQGSAVAPDKCVLFLARSGNHLLVTQTLNPTCEDDDLVANTDAPLDLGKHDQACNAGAVESCCASGVMQMKMNAVLPRRHTVRATVCIVSPGNRYFCCASDAVLLQLNQEHHGVACFCNTGHTHLDISRQCSRLQRYIPAIKN